MPTNLELEARINELQEQIDSMSSEALELMIKQQQENQGQTIFRQIINKEIPSVSVGENSKALAVLDINPISKGHVMILPKTPARNPKEIPKEAFELAKEISDKLI